MTSYRKINIASEKIIIYIVTSLSNHCCQIFIIIQEKREILVIIHFFLFLRCHSKIFKLLKQVHSYPYTLTSLYQFDIKFYQDNIYLFKVKLVTLRGFKKCSRLMKKSYNSLKRNQQHDCQLLQHLRGEQHNGIARYTQNRRVSRSSPTDALDQPLEPYLVTRSPVTFGSHLKQCCDQHRVNKAANFSVAKSWPQGSQMADRKKCEQFCFNVFTAVFEKQAKTFWSICSISRSISSHDHNVTDKGSCKRQTPKLLQKVW